MNRDFIGALLQLNAEKGVPQEILIQTLEQAIESAYRRNADAPENVVVKVNPESGEISVAREYEVVAGEQEIEDPELQMTAAAAQQIDPTTGAFLGNYPQAFSHIGVIASGVTLGRLQRGQVP